MPPGALRAGTAGCRAGAKMGPGVKPGVGAGADQPLISSPQQSRPGCSQDSLSEVSAHLLTLPAGCTEVAFLPASLYPWQVQQHLNCGDAVRNRSIRLHFHTEPLGATLLRAEAPANAA